VTEQLKEKGLPVASNAHFHKLLAIGSWLTGDIYHERFATLKFYAYAWYRNDALDFFYLFSQTRIPFPVHTQGLSHYQCGIKGRFYLLSHLSPLLQIQTARVY